VRRSGAFDVRIDIARLRPGQSIEGTWRLGIDSDPAVVGGFWTAERREDVGPVPNLASDLPLDGNGHPGQARKPGGGGAPSAGDATPGELRDGAAGQVPGRVVWRAR
jgi:hypothetical protein